MATVGLWGAGAPALLAAGGHARHNGLQVAPGFLVTRMRPAPGTSGLWCHALISILDLKHAFSHLKILPHS